MIDEFRGKEKKSQGRAVLGLEKRPKLMKFTTRGGVQYKKRTGKKYCLREENRKKSIR